MTVERPVAGVTVERPAAGVTVQRPAVVGVQATLFVSGSSDRQRS